MTIVVVGIAAMMLMTLTALVIDHSFLRNDRRADQKVADAAAAAGAFVLDREDGPSACEAALAHLLENLPEVDSFAGTDCEDDIPEFCDPATPAGVTTGTAGDYRIEIVHPIPDAHPLMARASALGAPAALVVEADGSSCQRIGVAVELTRGPSFGTVLGADEQTTRVHAVAKAGTPTPGLQPINLLILERYACHAVVVEGQAQLKLGAIVDTVLGRTFPGILAVDSAGYNNDGSLGANCGTASSPNVGTLHVQGSNALVQADGPIGCPSELTAGTGDGCGYLELFAPGVPGPASPLYCLNKAYWPACTSTGIVRPHPVRMPERRTREPFDHRFNCQNGYGNKPWFGGHPIGACPEASISGVDADYVDELESYAHNSGGSAPSGFSTYSNCDISSPTVIPEGNVFVDCDVFRVKSTVTFRGGNVIFRGSVDVTSGTGDLTIHACGKEGVDSCNPGTNALSWSGSLDEDGRWTTAPNYVESQYSSDAAWVYFRNGGIKKDAQAKVQIYDSTVFFRRSAALPCTMLCSSGQPTHVMALSGGTGSLVWHAPRQGPFDVLAMWSGSPLLHDMGGQSVLDMEGVYFAPVARLTYRGNGEQKQVAAQLVTERLTVTGGGTLIVRPNIHRAILDPEPYRSAIIR